jgi:polygalacturonase
MKRLAIIALLCFSPYLMAQGTYTAASDAYTDVNAVINGPTHTAVNGDIIQIPCSGSQSITWTSTLAYTANITITALGATPNTTPTQFGAGTVCLKIIDNTPGAVFQYEGNYSSSNNETVIQNMAIDPESTGTSLASPISLAGTCTSSGCPLVRVDNVIFGRDTQWTEGGNSSNADWMIRTDGVFGVLDHNTLPSNSTVELFNANLSAYLGVGGYGDNSYAQPDTFGGANVLYAENNNVYSDQAMYDCDTNPVGGGIGGCRVAARFNKFSEQQGAFALGIVHGLDTNGRPQSGRQQEAYGNTIDCPLSNSFECGDAAVSFRGGTGFVFGNTLTSSGGGSFSQIADGNIYRRVFNAGSGWNSCGGSGPFDTNDGTVYYSGNATSGSGGLTLNDTSKSWTTNQFVPAGAGYSVYDVTQQFWAEIVSNTATSATINSNIPESSNAFTVGDSYQILRATVCVDQIGRGAGGYVSGSTPTPSGALNQALDPVYAWGNSGAFVTNAGMGVGYGTNVKANRDWYTDAMNGSPTVQTSPTSPFNGTSGVGFGTLANRPTTCTAQVGYFATDQGSWNTSGNGFGSGVLYACTSANTWTSYYTPYTYPHPLDTVGTPAVQTPIFTPPAGTYTMPLPNTVISVPSPNSGATILACYNSNTACVPGSTGTQITCPSSGPCTVNVNPPSTVEISASATQAGYTASSIASALFTAATTAIATGDPTPRSEPSIPPTSSCTTVPAKVYQFYTNAVNVDPLNPTISTPNALGGTGGSDFQPSSSASGYTAAETDDTTLQAAINAAPAGGCVEVVMGSSGQDALVEGQWKPVNSGGNGVTVVVDAGVRIFQSRNPADFGSSCGTISTGGSSCTSWIEPSGANNANIMGYGALDGRAWSRFTSGSATSGFGYNRVFTYCREHGNIWQGITCTGTGTAPGVSYGANMWHSTGGSSNTVLYKTLFYDCAGFCLYWGDEATNFLGWGIKVIAPGSMSNNDGFDPSYGAQNWSLYNSYISNGDNHVSIKSKATGTGATQNGTIYNLQTSSGIGVTIGYESTVVSNILVNGLIQKGNPAITPTIAQQVGHGINGGNSQGGAVNLITYENTCVTGESERSLYYVSTSGTMTNISEINTHILDAGGSLHSGELEFSGLSGGLLGITLNNVVADGAVTHNNQYANIGLGPNNVSSNIVSALTGTGVTVSNNISNPSSTPFACTTSTWQPLVGDLSLSTPSNHNGNNFTGSAPAAYTLQAVLIPVMYVSGNESEAPTAGITFYDNGSALNGGTPVTLAHGNTTAALALTGVTSGTHVYTAKYNVSGADANYPTSFAFGGLTSNVGGSGTLKLNGPTKFTGTVKSQ